jgi:hypothetical protein
MTDRFAERKALLKDTLEAQARLADAAYQFQRALLGFWNARADLATSVGEECS